MDLDVLREAGRRASSTTGRKPCSRIDWAVPRRRLSATTCARRRGPRSAIRLTPSVYGARSPGSIFLPTTSPPWRERALPQISRLPALVLVLRERDLEQLVRRHAILEPGRRAAFA